MNSALRSICCNCTSRQSVETDRSLPLCLTCIIDGVRRPSDLYLSQYGVACSICADELVVPGLTCCNRCKTHNCLVCDIALADTTSQQHTWYKLCSHCTMHSQDNLYCLNCRGPVAKSRCSIVCEPCELKITTCRTRRCETCCKQLSESWPSKWTKCRTCFRGRSGNRARARGKSERV